MLWEDGDQPGGAVTTAGPSVSTLCEKGTSALGETTATSVYRYYDRYGVLIYVGITERGIRRNREHNATKAWWPHVVRQEVDHFATRDEASRHEKALIFRYRPPFNTLHNPDAESLRAAYLAFVAGSEDGEPDPLKLWQRAKGSLELMVIEQSDDLLRVSLSTRPTDFPLARAIAPIGVADRPAAMFKGNRAGIVADLHIKAESLAVLTIALRPKWVERVGRIRRATARLVYLSKTRQFGVKKVDVLGYDSPRRDPHYLRRAA